MNRITSSLLLALAIGASPAVAGGSAKDYGGLAGVPVPAPVPIMESFSWYVRTDIGVSVKSHGSSISTNPLGLASTVGYDAGEGPFHGSIGFGRYISKNLRWDAVFDYRGGQKTQNGLVQYNATTTSVGPSVSVGGTSVTSTNFHHFNVNRHEEVRMANHTLMMNLYYDLNRGASFSPYIGIGAGLTAREGRVEFNEVGECTHTTNDLVPGIMGCSEPDIRKSGKPSNVNWGPALALMLGFTYEVREGVLLDTGYRLSWQGGQTSITTPITGDHITGEARTDHEIRAGLRWNAW
jgi:opacity protein-like surface antigen